MSFNYDLATWIEYVIGAFACCFGGFFVGEILLNKKIKFYNYLFLLILSFMSVINSLIFENIAQIFIVLIIVFSIYKVIFMEKTENSILYSILTYILYALGEMTITVLAAIIILLLHYNIMDTIIKTFIGNILVAFIACIYAKFLKTQINNIISKINKKNVFFIYLLGVITVFVLISSMYKLYLNDWIIDYKFVLNTIIFCGFLVITIVLLKQYLKNKEMNDKYLLLKDYLKTSAELIEKYSSTVHKYKNNLIAIKGYLKSDMKEAEVYIDNLLGDYNNKKYNWFNKINYIQIDSIRYLIYYKLSKAETSNLKISVDVSKSIESYDNSLINIKEGNILLEILGELFDNAIYAGNESIGKELTLAMYSEDNNMIIILANTFKGEIDLSSITKNGYSTKGDNHGLGLYDIDKNIRKNNWISVNYETIDDYFVAKLILYFNKKNKKS